MLFLRTSSYPTVHASERRPLNLHVTCPLLVCDQRAAGAASPAVCHTRILGTFLLFLGEPRRSRSFLVICDLRLA
jgi:hypothetical protein